jgi:hypothetical protein
MNEKLAEAGSKGKKAKGGAKKATKTLKKAAKPSEKAEALGVKKVITKKKK